MKVRTKLYPYQDDYCRILFKALCVLYSAAFIIGICVVLFASLSIGIGMLVSVTAFWLGLYILLMVMDRMSI